MKSQRWRVAKPGKTASTKIALGERSTDRSSHGEEAPCSLRRSGGRGLTLTLWRFGAWQAQESSRLIERLAEGLQMMRSGNEV